MEQTTPLQTEQTAVPQTEEAEEQYEGTPEELTDFKPGSPGPAWFDRKKVMTTLCAAFAVIVMGALVFSTAKKHRQQTEVDSGSAGARPPREFLDQQLNKSLRYRPEETGEEGTGAETIVSETETAELPRAERMTQRQTQTTRQEDVPQRQPDESPPYEGGGGRAPPTTYPFSSLVPQVVEGSLFPSSSPVQAGRPGNGGTYAADYPYAAPGQIPQAPPSPALYQQNTSPYALQNNQEDKQAFYPSGSGGALSGAYLGDDLLWVGTIIPAVLETAVNTDLPGNVLARVSENVYDSRTGKRLLLPQGTVLVAQYNSSVSYAQHRVQIVWDLLIRPDGYQLALQGMNGVDPKGMSGLPAEYRENWFEYVKAAGLITMFSIANSRMAEEAAKYGSATTASNVTSSNAEFVNQIGGNVVSRAMNVQPTLTLRNGEKINVMLNKNIYLPPLDDNPVTQKYILK